MRELSREPSIDPSQSVHCQFGLFLCEVHIIVQVTTVSLTVSLLEQAILSGMNQDPNKRNEPS